MADFNFGDGLRKVFLAGVGALATTVEKSQEIVDDLVKKGELTVEQGKALNAELKHKVEEAKEAPEAKDAAPAETEDKAEYLQSFVSPSAAHVSARTAICYARATPAKRSSGIAGFPADFPTVCEQ